MLELFGGCGGAALGLHRAGWRHLACIERDPAAAATLSAAGFPVLVADVLRVDFAPWRDHVDLLWASPPCQPGSQAGRRRGSDDERDGWPATFAAVDAVRPTWFVAENVLGWTFHAETCDRDGEHAGCLGCTWEHHVTPALAKRFAFTGTLHLDAADLGVPQHRRRLFLWGGPLPMQAPAPSHGDPLDEDTEARGLAPWRTLRDAIGPTLLAADTCDRRACYPCGGTHGRACSERWRAEQPAPTVTTTEVKGTRAHAPDWTFNGGPDRASDTAFLVAGVRRIEVPEGLALQGMPPDWPLQGGREDQYRQVGNAVPPAMGAAVGATVLRAHRVLGQLRRQAVDVEDVAQAIRRASTGRAA